MVSGRFLMGRPVGHRQLNNLDKVGVNDTYREDESPEKWWERPFLLGSVSKMVGFLVWRWMFVVLELVKSRFRFVLVTGDLATKS